MFYTSSHLMHTANLSLVIPRYGLHLVPSFFGPAPNNLLQFDNEDLGEGAVGHQYAIMFCNDHSGYCWAIAFFITTAKDAAVAIQDWCEAFEIPGSPTSDGPTYFRNAT